MTIFVFDTWKISAPSENQRKCIFTSYFFQHGRHLWHMVGKKTLVTVRNVFSGSLSGNRAQKPKLGNFRVEYAHIMTDLEAIGVSHR